MTNGKAPDKIEEAIARARDKAATKDAEVEVTNYTLTLSSGKPALVGMANDADDRDWLDLLAIIVAQVRPAHMQMIQRKNPLSEILVPKHDLVLPS